MGRGRTRGYQKGGDGDHNDHRGQRQPYRRNWKNANANSGDGQASSRAPPPSTASTTTAAQLPKKDYFECFKVVLTTRCHLGLEVCRIRTGGHLAFLPSLLRRASESGRTFLGDFGSVVTLAVSGMMQYLIEDRARMTSRNGSRTLDALNLENIKLQLPSFALETLRAVNTGHWRSQSLQLLPMEMDQIRKSCLKVRKGGPSSEESEELVTPDDLQLDGMKRDTFNGEVHVYLGRYLVCYNDPVIVAYLLQLNNRKQKEILRDAILKLRVRQMLAGCGCSPENIYLHFEGLGGGTGESTGTGFRILRLLREGWGWGSERIELENIMSLLGLPTFQDIPSAEQWNIPETLIKNPGTLERINSFLESLSLASTGFSNVFETRTKYSDTWKPLEKAFLLYRVGEGNFGTMKEEILDDPFESLKWHPFVKGEGQCQFEVMTARYGPVDLEVDQHYLGFLHVCEIFFRLNVKPFILDYCVGDGCQGQIVRFERDDYLDRILETGTIRCEITSKRPIGGGPDICRIRTGGHLAHSKDFFSRISLIDSQAAITVAISAMMQCLVQTKGAWLDGRRRDCSANAIPMSEFNRFNLQMPPFALATLHSVNKLFYPQQNVRYGSGDLIFIPFEMNEVRKSCIRIQDENVAPSDLELEQMEQGTFNRPVAVYLGRYLTCYNDPVIVGYFFYYQYHRDFKLKHPNSNCLSDDSPFLGIAKLRMKQMLLGNGCDAGSVTLHLENIPQCLPRADDYEGDINDLSDDEEGMWEHRELRDFMKQYLKLPLFEQVPELAVWNERIPKVLISLCDWESVGKLERLNHYIQNKCRNNIRRNSHAERGGLPQGKCDDGPLDKCCLLYFFDPDQNENGDVLDDHFKSLDKAAFVSHCQGVESIEARYGPVDMKPDIFHFAFLHNCDVLFKPNVQPLLGNYCTGKGKRAQVVQFNLRKDDVYETYNLFSNSVSAH